MYTTFTRKYSSPAVVEQGERAGITAPRPDNRAPFAKTCFWTAFGVTVPRATHSTRVPRSRPNVGIYKPNVVVKGTAELILPDGSVVYLSPDS